MFNSFSSSPAFSIETVSTVKKVSQEQMNCEIESIQSKYHEPVMIRPIPISPCGDDINDSTQHQTKFLDRNEGMGSQSRESVNSGIVSVPSDDELMEDESVENHEFGAPLDYRIDWTAQMNENQCLSRFRETSNLEIEDTFVSFGDDDVSLLDDISDETFDKEEMTSLSLWMKSNNESDIWVI